MKVRSERGGAEPGAPAGLHREGDVVEAAVLDVMKISAHCRLLGGGAAFNLRAERLWTLAPGQVVTFRVKKSWTYGGRPYLSGVIEGSRVEARALGLTPLRLVQQGTWDPEEEDWCEPGAAAEGWARQIRAWGPRAEFEMEQVLPGVDLDDPFDDPIIEALELRDAGDYSGAYDVLAALCRADLRCLDAHAHLGNIAFDRRPQDAIRHYEVGVRIGELSLDESFDGLLPWGWLDNRPFLRCQQGYGLCLWRLGRWSEAARVFERMLWLNPPDHQGIRFLLEDVRAGREWKSE